MQGNLAQGQGIRVEDFGAKKHGFSEASRACRSGEADSRRDERSVGAAEDIDFDICVSMRKLVASHLDLVGFRIFSEPIECRLRDGSRF